MNHLRTRPHPVGMFLAYLLLGPFIIAGAVGIIALAVLFSLVGAVVFVASGRRS